MTKQEEIAEMIATAEKSFGSVDVLVNNAGIQFVSPIEDFPVDKWNQIIAINLSAAFHAIRAAVPGMKQRKWGRIISTASAHSLVASPFKVAYVAAKHGIAGITKTVALETATDGITVNCISPGYVWTPLVEKQIPDTMKARNMTREQVINEVLLTAQPTKEFVTVDEVAAIAIFLCSDAAKQITGANISVDASVTALRAVTPPSARFARRGGGARCCPPPRSGGRGRAQRGGGGLRATVALKTKKPELAGSGFSVSLVYRPQKTPITIAPKNMKTSPSVVS